MTKFEQKSFSVHLGSKSYAENFDRIFNNKDEEPEECDCPVDYKSTLAVLNHIASEGLLDEPSTVQEQVLLFHKAYDVKIRTAPEVPTRDEVRLRLKLITEEYLELMVVAGVINPNDHMSLVKDLTDAAGSYVESDELDLVEFADACADLDFVVEGARQVFGISGPEIAEEVFRSNMSKLGEDGKPVRREDGKITKGPNFSPPDIAGELAKQK